jgi:hypothetical protein
MTTLAEAVTATTDLTQTVADKEAATQALLDAALNAVPDLIKTFYVDAVTGDDANAGDDPNPLATINEAVDRTVPGGAVKVFLKSNVLVSTTINLKNKILDLESSSPTKHHITFDRFVDNGNREVRGFDMDRSRISFKRLRIDMPAKSGIYVGTTQTVKSAPIRMADGARGSYCEVRIDDCETDFKTPQFGPMIESANSLYGLYVRSWLQVGEPYRGLFFDDYTATGGTNTAGIGWLLTNIAQV